MAPDTADQPPTTPADAHAQGTSSASSDAPVNVPTPTDAPTADAALVPLCVDLDGTLVSTDTLWESYLRLLRRSPWGALGALAALRGGRPAFKRYVAERMPIDAATLPYRPEVLALIQQTRAAGRPVWLTTGADAANAAAVADHLGCFDGIIATGPDEDGLAVNNIGAAKLDAIRHALGDGPFDYAGDSTADLPLWRAAQHAYTVAPPSAVSRELAGSGGTVTAVVEKNTARPRELLRAMRPHQWAKNLLLIGPMATGFALGDAARWGAVLVGIVSFCLVASAIYLVNDLLDLPADRDHPRKRRRPLAAGTLPIPWAVAAAPALVVVGGTLAALLLPGAFLAVLGVYTATTLLYSLRIKGMAILDVLVLASLYVLRIIAGGVAVGLFPSAWLLALGSFLFLSLAFAKRYTELTMLLDRGDERAAGRGYHVEDLPLIGVMGVVSGYLAVLVLAFYINSDFAGANVTKLYARPAVLWLTTPLLLYWISRLWFRAHRRTLRGDPLLFAMADPVTYLLFALTAVVAWLAH